MVFGNASVQVADEFVGAQAVTLADVERQDRFCLRIER